MALGHVNNAATYTSVCNPYIKDTFRCTNLYSGNTFLPLKEDNLSIMDISMCLFLRGSTVYFSTKNVTHFRSGITKQKHVLTHCTGGDDDFSPDPLGMSIPLDEFTGTYVYLWKPNEREVRVQQFMKMLNTYIHVHVQYTLYIMDTLGQIIIERKKL